MRSHIHLQLELSRGSWDVFRCIWEQASPSSYSATLHNILML